MGFSREKSCYRIFIFFKYFVFCTKDCFDKKGYRKACCTLTQLPFDLYVSKIFCTSMIIYSFGKFNHPYRPHSMWRRRVLLARTALSSRISCFRLKYLQSKSILGIVGENEEQKDFVLRRSDGILTLDCSQKLKLKCIFPSTNYRWSIEVFLFST